MQFLAGAGCAVVGAIVLFIFAPLLWLLTGGDLAGQHWLLDGNGSIIKRWRWRKYNGRDPHRKS